MLRRSRLQIHLCVALVGFTAASTGSLLRFWARSVGIECVNSTFAIGSLIIGKADLQANQIGLVLHLFLGACFALIYERIFRSLKQTGWLAGLWVASGHWLLTAFTATLGLCEARKDCSAFSNCPARYWATPLRNADL